MTRVSKFLRLDRADRRLVLRAACVLVAMSIGLRVLPMRRLQAVAARGAATPAGLPAARRHSAERIAWAVRVSARNIPWVTCLPQALAVQFMLVRHGHPACLRIGVTRTEEGRVAGHAWVEGADGLVIGRADTRYALLEGVVGQTL